MKILFLLTQDLESPSGLGRYYPLARELVRLGHQVTIAALHSNYPSIKNHRLEIEGVHVRYVGPMHVKKIGNVKRYYATSKLILLVTYATFRLTLTALYIKADITFICKPHPMNSIAGFIAKLLKKTRILFLDVDDYESASGNFADKIQLNIMKIFENKVPKYVDKITTNTYFMKNKLISWGISPDKIVYLPNGVDLDRFPSPSSQSITKIKKDLGIINKKVIGYIGSMSLSNHSIELLMEAFSEILKQRLDVILLMIGGGEDFEKLIEKAHMLKIENNIIFTGKIPPERVYLYYHICNVTVDPAIDDDACRARSPLKLFESLACGVPIVTTNVGDRAINLQSYKEKLLISTVDKFSLAKKIIDIIGDNNLCQQIKKQTKSNRKEYSWENIVKHFYYNYLYYYNSISSKL